MEGFGKPIFLVGFMASGKTTLGRFLVKELKTEFVDSDDTIMELEGLSIQEIFSQKGEKGFRNLEKDFIQEYISTKKTGVVATGGGMPCYNQMMDVLNAYGITVYVKTSPQVIFKRLLANRGHRPLIKDLDNAQLVKFIEHTLAEREPFYTQSQIVVNGDLTKKDAVQHILNSLKKTQENG